MTKTTLILGVDPGLHGGIAIVDIAPHKPVLIMAIDIPLVGEKAKERVDVQEFYHFLARYDVSHAMIERANAMPRQGSASGFKYGRAVGALETTIILCDIPITIVNPRDWKKVHRLKGGPKEKESSRQRALQLFPKAHSFFARKLDHGRAEAALIALTYVGFV